MFRVMNKLKSDKRGFTLTELLVTMTILLIALTLTVSLAGVIWRNYRLVEYRWIIQTAVEFVAGCFQREAHNEAFATANEADLYYEPKNPSPGDTFSFDCAPELGSIKLRDDGSLVFNTNSLTDELKTKLQDDCIYLLIINDRFYNVRYDNLYHLVDSDTETYEYADGTADDTSHFAPIYPVTSQLQLVEPDVADVKVSIEFSVAGNVLPYDATTHDESKTATYTSYINTAVSTEIHGSIVSVNDATLRSETTLKEAIDLINMDGNTQVNYSNGQLSSTYVAGWNKGETLSGYPSSLTITSGSSTETVANPTVAANVVKYHSFNTAKRVYDGTTGSDFFNVDVQMPACLFMSLTIGSDNQKEILKPIRDFRDNVLKGTVIGDWMIDKYYDWSPKVIMMTEELPELKAVLQFFTKELSAVLAAVE